MSTPEPNRHRTTGPSASPPGGHLCIGNGDLEVTVDLAPTVRAQGLVDVRRRVVYADAGYRYSFAVPGAGHTTVWSAPPRYESHRLEEPRTGGVDLTVHGTLDLDRQELAIEHRFAVPADRPYLEEWIALTNRGTRPVAFSAVGCGFLASLRSPSGEWVAGAGARRAVAVPYRREPMGGNGEYWDFSMDDLCSRNGWYRLEGWRKGRFYTPAFASEGWILTDGTAGLLIVKYSQELMETSLLAVEGFQGREAERPWESEQGVRLRFGGCGTYHADPEAAGRLEPGQRLAFGRTRYTAFDGGWQEGYALFRQFMEEHGHGVPPGYDPPVQWNELYDNPLWWAGDTPENRERFYRLPDLEVEAEKARAVGCEALYLDPGWDQPSSPTTWADDRLGPLPEFVQRLRTEYGLGVALHAPLTGWEDPATYPRSCDRMNPDGTTIHHALCNGAETFLRIKTERLLRLAEQGVAYVMFDGNGYTGPCYHPDHGHPIPYTREAHCRACLRLAQALHERFPKLIVEMHDMVVAGQPVRYCPTYYLHGLPGSFDENWAFEYMWDPMDDLLSGRSISLYYYNLAYSLPLYLHMPARTDNRNGLQFWWYASTVRHLGIGGVGDDPVTLAVLKRCMQQYRALKPYFVQGRFHGLDELTHVHALPGQGAVGLWFNLSDELVERSSAIDLQRIGIEPDSFRGIEQVGAEGEGEQINGLVRILRELIGREPGTLERLGRAGSVPQGERLVVTVRIPARSVVLARLLV